MGIPKNNFVIIAHHKIGDVCWYINGCFMNEAQIIGIQADIDKNEKVRIMYRFYCEKDLILEENVFLTEEDAIKGLARPCKRS